MIIAVIGGGAAGFFAAITVAQHYPQHKVIILEKTSKTLAKVRVSGGGRCNVTNHCFEVPKLAKNYPRGEKNLKQGFAQFAVADTIQWFETRGVKLKTEPDGRMFPTTDNSETIVQCLLQEIKKYNVEIRLQQDITKINITEKGFLLNIANQADLAVHRVIVATGGNPKEAGFAWLKALGLDIAKPVPSLFTFNIPNNPVVKLMGVATKARVRIQGSKLAENGALLITHWGISGPVVLRLSAWGARELAEKNYQFNIQIQWLPDSSEELLRPYIDKVRQSIGARQIANKNPFEIPSRLWEYFLDKINIPHDKLWRDLNKKEINRLVNILMNDIYEVRGKTTFKEEFVTCGGVSLTEIDFERMESKKIKGLFFAGEVLDIDGITGGFNFQAAWTTGYIAGVAAGK
jgi:predicted Rossmann fold flavoprotein